MKRIAARTLDSEKVQHILDCIFSDQNVIETLACAVLLKNIANSDAPPDGLLLKLKAGPFWHIKERYYDYMRVLKTERAHIQRLQLLQKKVGALIGIGLLAMLSAVCNFLIGLFSNKLYYGEWVPDLRLTSN